jgi:hypothetical protein
MEPVTDCPHTLVVTQPIISKLSVNFATLRWMTEPTSVETIRLKLTMAISFFRGWWRADKCLPKTKPQAAFGTTILLKFPRVLKRNLEQNAPVRTEAESDLLPVWLTGDSQR